MQANDANGGKIPMEIKICDVLILYQTLKHIIDDSQIKLDPLFKFRLLGIMKSLEPHIENFEVIRKEKIKEYGKESETDGSISIPPDDAEAVENFQKDISLITDSFINVNIDKLKAEEIFNKGISADCLISLYPIIEG